jgi:hypothetical protein
MAEPRFQTLQRAFTARIRDPERNAVPADIEPRRMKIYDELFFNNVSSLLAGTFPVVHEVLGRTRWDALMRDFLIRHRAHTPLFPELPQELLAFLQGPRAGHADDPPFLLELAHYEWVELALQIAPEEPKLGAVDRDGDLLAGRPVVNPLAWSLGYSFPVHTIDASNQPAADATRPTFLVVHRGLDDEVRFMEINAVTARLLDLLAVEDDARSGREFLLAIAEDLQHPDPEVVVQGGAATLALLRERDIVLGTRR